MTKLNDLNPSNFYCSCGMTTKDTPHTCIDSRVGTDNHLPLVGILLIGVVVVIAGLWAVEVWR